MKKLLPLFLIVFTASGALGQVPAMRRLVQQTAKSTDWIPIKEKTGNLVKFSQGTKKLGVTTRSSGLTWSDLSARGFQYVPQVDGAVPSTRRLLLPGTHETGPHTATLGKPVTQWTQAECYHFGRNVTPVVGLTGDQYNEGYSAQELDGFVHTQSNQYRWIYEGMRDKAATMNPRPILIGSYEAKFDSFESFQPGGGAWNPNTPANRNAIATAANARSGLWWFDLAVSKYVMPIYQVYPHVHSDKLLYQQAYGIQRLQKACEGWGDPGYTLGAYTFVWPFIADNPTGLGKNLFPFEHNMTAGKLYQHSHSALSFDTFVSLCLNTFVLAGTNGGIYVWEDGLAYSDANPDKVESDYTGQYMPADIWKPFNTAPAPLKASKPTMPKRPQGIFSAPIVAAEFYGEMIAAGGENFQFKRFKIGNGAWIEPGPSESSILEAAAGFRGWCKVSQNGNGFGLYYTNPRAPRGGETVTVDLGGGKTVTFDCFNNEPVCIAGNHPGGNATYTRNAAF